MSSYRFVSRMSVIYYSIVDYWFSCCFSSLSFYSRVFYSTNYWLMFVSGGPGGPGGGY